MAPAYLSGPITRVGPHIRPATHVRVYTIAPGADNKTKDRTMQLRSFRVTYFRNIIDSGDIPVEPVTALVGKNESGKSAILQALHHLNPAKPPAALNLLDEYPRWLKKEHEITGEIGHAV